ncbi:MAG TPA: methionyl-tRNA formyltransferase, partial [Thermoanaerobaculia bacterium]|nr:methionyl-tRNA formyltransferase [Thermoanaerobaculia bacterium]
MRLVFFGSPEFAVPSLEALVAAGHEIALVVSQPARPVGRHGEPSDPAVARLAKSLSLPLFQPESLKADDAVARLAGPRADLFVVAAYGKILAQRVLDLPRLFCLNVHGSVLPRWRGASPVQAAILAGDATTGVSIMKME